MTDLEKQLRRARIIKMVSFIGVIFVFFLILFMVENLLLSFVLALIITYIFNPLVNILERNGTQRVYSVLILYSIFSIVLAFLVVMTMPLFKSQMASLKSELPRYTEGVTSFLQRAEENFATFGGFSGISVSEEVKSILLSVKASLFDDLPTFLSKSLTTLLLAPFFAFFMLKDGRSATQQLLSLVPNSIFELTLNLQYQINEQMAQFVRARVLEAIIVGLVVWIGLASFGFPFAVILGTFAAIMNLIPYVGPIIGAVPAIVIALFNQDVSFSVAIVVGVYSVAQLIDIVFIIPMVVAKLVDLHPVTVVVVIIIGAQLLGVLGMLISIPVTSALKVSFTSIYSHLTEFRS